MPQAIPLGAADAWQDDAGKWFFAPYRFMASANAITVQRHFADGEIFLEYTRGDGSIFIRGAEQTG